MSESKRTLQLRTFPVELRAADGEKPQIGGHAAVFNQLSEEIFGFREQIAPGAFSKTIQESDIRALLNHDANFVLGRNRAGTLALSEDQRGLVVTINPPDSEWARSLLESMRRGDVDQMSIGFYTIRDRWEEDREKETITRTLIEVKLRDVSVVTFPAYPQTDASVRAITDFDFPALARCALRAEHGLSLVDTDRTLMQQAIERFSRMVAPGTAAHPTEDSAVTPHSDEIATPSATESGAPGDRNIAALRMRLRLVESMA